MYASSGMNVNNCDQRFADILLNTVLTGWQRYLVDVELERHRDVFSDVVGGAQIAGGKDGCQSQEKLFHRFLSSDGLRASKRGNGSIIHRRDAGTRRKRRDWATMFIAKCGIKLAVRGRPRM